MNLLLTLGHNASALWTDGVNVIGYERERLSRTKSDSHFPGLSINEIVNQVGKDGPANLFVSHWFDCKSLTKARHPRLERYWNRAFVNSMTRGGGGVFDVNWSFTHHDAHAWAAVEFYRQHVTTFPKGTVHIIVCDGFGTRQEVFSIYTIKPWNCNWIPCLHSRISGFKWSLGMLYQYATSFCGMRENQDEYKFLGYESRVGQVTTPNTVKMIENLAEALVEKWWWSSGGLFDGNVRYNANDFINTSHLHKVKAYWHEHFNKVLQTVNLNVRGSKDGIKKSLVWQNDLSGRAVIGHYVQMILEVFYRHVIGEFQVENAIVTGGVHYNVKLNNFILKNIPGQFCAVPLAGDQGAAIGVYVKHGFRFPFTSLQWGRRVLPSPQGHTGTFEVDGARVYWKIGSAKVYWTDSRDSYVDTVTELLKQDHIVNTITGNMEFGPRALCNTSTLALATKENVDIINALNGRDTIMPFAPVMLEEKARRLFSPAELDRTIGSDRYMIVTHDWRQKVQPEWEGVTHPYPDGSGFSGRPQVIYPGDLMPVREILENLGGGPIINTSLNVHGMPIVFSEADAIDDFKFNLKMAKRHLIKKGPVLVIGAF